MGAQGDDAQGSLQIAGAVTLDPTGRVTPTQSTAFTAASLCGAYALNLAQFTPYAVDATRAVLIDTDTNALTLGNLQSP
jgi:hypothetical protein